jgi:hypothetical protein
MTSPNTSTSAVMTSVAQITPVSPNNCRKAVVASDDARILTRLLPSRMPPISRSGCSFSFSTRPAFWLPRRWSSCSRARDDVVSAVSEPEKKADRMIRPNAAPSMMLRARVI